MLKLSFKDGSKLRIGDDITLIFHINKGQVKVAIDAPKDVKVLREEVLERNNSQ